MAFLCLSSAPLSGSEGGWGIWKVGGRIVTKHRCPSRPLCLGLQKAEVTLQGHSEELVPLPVPAIPTPGLAQLLLLSQGHHSPGKSYFPPPKYWHAN